MGTKIRANISKKNPYFIESHRYYELKHHCLQYPDWVRKIREIENTLIPSASIFGIESDDTEWHDPTGNAATSLAYLKRNIAMVDQAAIKADPSIAYYIMKSVTEGASYTYLRTTLGMPCGKGYFYKAYRKFWWILSHDRYSGYGF